MEYEPNISIPTVHKHAIFIKFQWWFLMAMNFEHNQVLRIITRLVMKGYIGTDDDIHWLSVRSVRLVNGRNDMPIPNDYTHGRCQTCIVIYFKGNNQYLWNYDNWSYHYLTIYRHWLINTNVDTLSYMTCRRIQRKIKNVLPFYQDNRKRSPL